MLTFPNSSSSTNEPTRTAEILTVCTGNICRSALATLLLTERLRDLGVKVHGAGTGALVDSPPSPETQQLAQHFGAASADIEAHRARQLTERIAATVDLALPMTRDHRRQLVEMSPALLKRAFTAREFSRLSTGMSRDDIARAAEPGRDSPSQRLRSALRELASRRGIVGPPSAPEDDDVIDPYRKGWEVYELEASQLIPALDEITRFVRAALS